VVAGDVTFGSFSLPRRRGERLACGSDEDAVTLAIDAAERALAGWRRDRGEIDAVHVVLGHGPEIIGTLAHAVREALGLRPGVRVVPFAADPVTAVSALQAACAFVGSGELRAVLVVASEAAAGADERSAGAAAVVVAPGGDGGAAVVVEEVARFSELTHERLRPSAEGEFLPDVRFLQHRYAAVVGSALASAPQPALGELDGVFFAGGWRQVQAGIRASHGLDQAFTDVVTEQSDFGVAGPIVALLDAATHRAGGDLGLVVFGDGQAVVLRVRTPGVGGDSFGWSEPRPSGRRPGAVRTQGPALPLPVESPFFARSWGETLRLVAAKCTTCGQVVFPPSQRTICSGCGGREWSEYALPRTGTILTFVDNHFLPAGFPESMVLALGELEDGVHYWAPMPPEIAGEDVAIGDRVALKLRRFTIRDGIPVYGMKYVPAPLENGGR
jgi:uncharacterized OB-fold protein